MNPVQKACDALGGQRQLATALGVTPSAVNQWVTGATRVTAERAAQIEKATNGAVTRNELRPDVFGEPAAA